MSKPTKQQTAEAYWSTADAERTLTCPVRTTLNVLGGKWKLLILSYLLDEPRRYGELRRQPRDLGAKSERQAVLGEVDRGGLEALDRDRRRLVIVSGGDGEPRLEREQLGGDAQGERVSPLTLEHEVLGQFDVGGVRVRDLDVDLRVMSPAQKSYARRPRRRLWIGRRRARRSGRNGRL